jgi:4-amino-4-deoxy-L-arabinose transferase-like glycosyltransferase
MQSYGEGHNLEAAGSMDTAIDQNRVRPLDLVCLTTLAALIIFPGLGQLRACISHEILHAETIREMAESGNFVETKILGERIPDKPPVMHAPAALLTRWLGRPSMTVARVPSALAGLLGILATYGIGLALLGRRAALVGAVALLGVPGYSLLAREALPDMILCTGILFSCLGLVLGMRASRPLIRILCLAAAGFCAGVAVLAKGPVGLLFPVFFAVLVPVGLPELKRPRLGWVVFGAGLLVSTGIWAIPAYLLDQGVYLRQVIFQPDLDLTAKVKTKPFYTLLGVALVHSLPLSIFLPMTIRDWRRYGYSPLLAVAAAILLTFVCVPKKRDHYLLPMYPFLALAIAASIVRHSETSRLVRRAAWTLVPLSLLSFPIFFTVIQPLVLPDGDPEIRFAKDSLPIVGPNGRVYCVHVDDEVLAWVGRRYDGIVTVRLGFPDEVDQLRRAPKGAYLLADQKSLDEILRVAGPLPRNEVLSRRVKSRTWVLFRLGDGS